MIELEPKQSAWIEQIFKAGAAVKGNVVRRSLKSVAANASLPALIETVRQRGFHMIIIGDQCVIVCNPGELRLIC